MAGSRGESAAHRNLKRAALYWAQREGYAIAGMEVRVPSSRYRADVAAYRAVPGRALELGATALFECKQSRPDFLKDRHLLQQNLARLGELNQRRLRLERQLGIHHPSLRCGDALFQEYETVNLSALRHEGYQALMRELDQVQRRIYGKTKFDRMVRWRCANAFYVVIPAGLMDADELPAEWGILSAAPPELLDIAGPPAALTLIRKPRWNEIPFDRRLELLQRIAASGTRLWNQASGIPAPQGFPARQSA